MARLMLCAPEEPPVTIRVGLSCSSPRAVRAAGAGSAPVQTGDFAAHWHSDVPRAAEPSAVERDGDVLAQPGTDPVGEPWPGVGLMDHDRDLAPPGGKVQRGADVAADADQDVRPGVVQDAAGLPHGAGKLTG